jgi:hypothetical protein
MKVVNASEAGTEEPITRHPVIRAKWRNTSDASVNHKRHCDL